MSVRRIIMFAVLLSSSACAYLEPRHHVKKVDIGQRVPGYSVDAKSRFIWAPRVTNQKGKRRTVLCAEPSPDALSTIAATLDGKLDIEAAKYQVGAEARSTLTETAKVLGTRTVTIQALRDALYRACEAYISGSVNEFGYALIIAKYDNVLLSLVALATLDGRVASNSTTPEKEAIAAKAEAERDRLKSLYAGPNREYVTAKNKFNKLAESTAARDKKISGLEAKIKEREAQLGSEKAKTDGQLNEDKAKLAELKGENKAESRQMEAAKTKMDAAQNALGEPHKALLKAEKEAADKRAEALAAKAKDRASVTAQVLGVLRQSDDVKGHLTTVAGACMMWLSQNPNYVIRRTGPRNVTIVDRTSKDGSAPAAAYYCSQYLTKVRKIGEGNTGSHHGRTVRRPINIRRTR